MSNSLDPDQDRQNVGPDLTGIIPLLNADNFWLVLSRGSFALWWRRGLVQ